MPSYRIHPAIGVARVGNSSGYYIGPEKPNAPPNPEGGFKDFSCRVKRQGARFRIFEYSDDAEPTATEVTTSTRRVILWT